MKLVLSRSLGFNIELNKVEITQRLWDGPDCYNWRETFAFLPVKTISGKRVWLKKVYVRRCWVVWGQSFHMEPHVEYGTFFDVIKNYERT